MTARRIDRRSVDSIQDIDDVKTWARDHEIRVEHKLEQVQAAISEHRKGIDRNWKWLLIAIGGFGVILCALLFETFRDSSKDRVSYERGRLGQSTEREYRQAAQLTLKDVVEKVGVHKDTIINWITVGKVNVTKKKNRSGHYRFSEKDLEVLREYAGRVEEVDD